MAKDRAPIEWLPRECRYGEKLATPDAGFFGHGAANVPVALVPFRNGRRPPCNPCVRYIVGSGGTPSTLVMDATEHPPIRVHPRPAVLRDGWLRHGAVVEGLPNGDAELWFDCEPRHAGILTSRGDPWSLALIFAAMQDGSALAVDGEISRELLANLEAFQETWRLWIPDQYRPVRLQATAEVADPGRPASDAGAALMVFRGGLDDCYTAYRHARRLAGRQTLPLRAGLIVLGLPPRRARGSDSCVEDARALLGDLGLDLWVMRTNAGAFTPVWEHACGAVLASCLHWFGGGMAVGVFPATGTLTDLSLRRGSNPLTDPWLTSDRMRIIHDGAEHDLVEKAESLATWPEAVRRLRGGPGPRRVLASLALSLAGAPADAPRGDAAIDTAGSLALDDAGLVRDARAVLQAADARGLPQPPWYEPLRQSLGRAEGSVNQRSGRAAPASGRSFRWTPRRLASEIHVFPEAPALVDERIVIGARIEGLDHGPRALWFSVEARHAPYLTSRADPFACALQFPAMRSGASLVIHGPVSRALLRNLEQFQRIWHTWEPQHVMPVTMRAAQEVEDIPVGRETLMLFSGGLDSCFSAYRHHRGLAGRRSRRISAGLMVLGFDIPHVERKEFRASFENSRRMLGSLGIDLWSMATNIRDVLADWEPGHGTAMAAGAHCFAGHIRTALLAATSSVASFSSRWGTHELTDRLLSSDLVRVVTDGEDTLGRLDKALLIAEWPEAMSGLRVCFESERRDRNCGECPKCVLTALMFLAQGLPLPSTLGFPEAERVHRLPLRGMWEVRMMGRLLERARARGVANQACFLAIPECLRWNEERLTSHRARWLPRRPLWPRVRRRLLRGFGQWGG